MLEVSEILKKVRRIEIVASRTVNELFAGQYKSVFRGRGMEFNEVREYQPGDEIRTIDWNVTAREGKPFIKRFVEERELTILFVVDISASNLFGSQNSKLESAIEVAAALMFSALKNNDKVGLVTFADRVTAYHRPRKGKANVLHLIRELIAVQPVEGITDLKTVLEYVSRVQKRRCVVFLLSDFLQPELLGTEPRLENEHDIFPKKFAVKNLMLQTLRRKEYQNEQERALSMCGKKHDLVAMQFSDQREQEFPNVGLIMLRDAETNELLEVDTSSAAVRRELSKRFQAGQEHINDTLRRCRIDRLNLTTDGDFVADLRRFFRKRRMS
jgi:uncharacterized protein (DUF58 family)